MIGIISRILYTNFGITVQWDLARLYVVGWLTCQKSSRVRLQLIINLDKERLMSLSEYAYFPPMTLQLIRIKCHAAALLPAVRSMTTDSCVHATC
mgnify:CR=1 FL=1